MDKVLCAHKSATRLSDGAKVRQRMCLESVSDVAALLSDDAIL